MLNLLLYLVLLCEVVFFTYFDRKVFANYFSPVVILSYPILIVITIAFTLGTSMGFKQVNCELLLLTITGIFIFWLGSFFWSVLVPRSMVNKISVNFSCPGTDVSDRIKKITAWVAVLVIIFLVFSFISTFLKYNSVNALNTEEFLREFAGSNIIGHVMGLIIPLLIFFISIVKRKDYIIWLIIFLLVILALLYQVKTWLFIPLIGGVILRFFKKRKIKLTLVNVIVIIVIIMLLFGLTYLFPMAEKKNVAFFDKIQSLFNHFMGYVFAGVLGFGEHMKEHMPVGQSPETLFMPFVNLYNYVAGNKVEGVVSPYHVFIDNRGVVDVNVKTFFGTILINGGYVIGSIYVFFISVILYLIWIIASFTKNYWFIILYFFLASALFLGWFDFYYNQLPFLELPVYMIILVFITQIKRKKTCENYYPGQS